jgi:glycosyltransferase involved in cell wall biosynthesis
LQNPDDPAELKTKLAYFLDPLRWPSLSRQARQVAEQYSWSAYLEMLEQTLLSLCDRPELEDVAATVGLPTFSGTHRAR